MSARLGFSGTHRRRRASSNIDDERTQQARCRPSSREETLARGGGLSANGQAPSRHRPRRRPYRDPSTVVVGPATATRWPFRGWPALFPGHPRRPGRPRSSPQTGACSLPCLSLSSLFLLPPNARNRGQATFFFDPRSGHQTSMDPKSTRVRRSIDRNAAALRLRAACTAASCPCAVSCRAAGRVGSAQPCWLPCCPP